MNSSLLFSHQRVVKSGRTSLNKCSLILCVAIVASVGSLVLVDKEFGECAGGIDVFFVKRVVNAKLPAVIGMALDGKLFCY